MTTAAHDGDDEAAAAAAASGPSGKAPPGTGSTQGYEYASEILITKTELEEKNRLVFNLQQQVDETKYR